MPYRVRHFAGSGFAVAELSGPVGWDDVEAAIRAVYLSPLWEPGGRVLWDATALASAAFLPSDLPAARALFTEIAEAREGGRTAFLLGSGAEEEVWVLFPNLGPPSTREVRVFRDRALALAFLGPDAMPDGGGVVAGSPPVWT